jgi:hypothetical protein
MPIFFIASTPWADWLAWIQFTAADGDRDWRDGWLAGQSQECQTADFSAASASGAVGSSMALLRPSSEKKQVWICVGNWAI